MSEVYGFPWAMKGSMKFSKSKILRMDLSTKKLLKEPNHEKIVDFLTTGKRKWSSTKKNPHESINRGSLTEEAKVWFYSIASVIIPTKHLSTIRE